MGHSHRSISCRGCLRFSSKWIFLYLLICGTRTQTLSLKEEVSSRLSILREEGFVIALFSIQLSCHPLNAELATKCVCDRNFMTPHTRALRPPRGQLNYLARALLLGQLIFLSGAPCLMRGQWWLGRRLDWTLEFKDLSTNVNRFLCIPWLSAYHRLTLTFCRKDDFCIACYEKKMNKGTKK